MPSLQVAGERRGFAGDAFHHVAVAGHDVGVVVEEVAAVGVRRRQLRLGDREPDRVGEALPERSGRDLDPGGVVVFRDDPAYGCPIGGTT